MHKLFLVSTFLFLIACEEESSINSRTVEIQVSNNSLICSAFKYNEDIIITAAHCVDDSSVKTVKVAGRSVSVQQVIVHEEWDPKLVRNDLALIILERGDITSDINLGLNDLQVGDGLRSITLKDGKKKNKGHTVFRFDLDRIRLKDNSKNDAICKGNSGGPVYYVEGDNYTLVGIASGITKVRNDCNDGGDTIVVDINKQRDWILTNIL